VPILSGSIYSKYKYYKRKHITATGYLDVAGFRCFINCILLLSIKSLLCVFVII